MASPAVAVITAIGTGSPKHAQAGSSDATAVVEDFFDRLNDGDSAGAAALVADDIVFAEIHAQTGSFATVGKPAFVGSILEEVATSSFSAVLTDLAADGNVVSGVGEFTDDETATAGVDRRLQPFTITLNDAERISRAEFTFDETDAQTATYLEWLASQSGEDEGVPQGGTTVTLAAQPGGNQPGIAVIFAQEALSVVGLFIEPGADGVLQPAHFHTGTCANPGPIVQPLASVLDGASFTLLSASPDELIGQGLIINVHKSASEAGVYVSCGEVLAASEPEPSPRPAAATPTPAPSTGVTAPNTGSGPKADDDGRGWPAAIVALLALGSLSGVGAVAARLRARPR
jgi:ketosteroid isomerase-like protein